MAADLHRDRPDQAPLDVARRVLRGEPQLAVALLDELLLPRRRLEGVTLAATQLGVLVAVHRLLHRLDAGETDLLLALDAVDVHGDRVAVLVAADLRLPEVALRSLVAGQAAAAVLGGRDACEAGDQADEDGQEKAGHAGDLTPSVGRKFRSRELSGRSA